MASAPGFAATLLDSVLPARESEFGEYHVLEIHAAPEAVMAAVKAVRPSEIAWLRILFFLRALPARLLTRPWHWARSSARRHESFLAMTLESGWVQLAEDEREIVVASIGQFWKLTGSHTVRVASAAEFRAFHVAGYARTAANFRIEPVGPERVRLTTETRIIATDDEARRKFGPYWAVVKPFTALIRRGALRAIRRRAERR